MAVAKGHVVVARQGVQVGVVEVERCVGAVVVALVRMVGEGWVVQGLLKWKGVVWWLVEGGMVVGAVGGVAWDQWKVPAVGWWHQQV